MAVSPLSFVRRVVAAVDRRVRTRMAISALRRDARSLQRGDRLGIVVAVRGSVHLAEAALRHLVGHVETVCVLNGLTEAERVRLEREFGGAKFLKVGFPLRHHDVIEPLIRAWDEPFWLVDHDCFVLEPDALRQAEVASEGTVGAVFYGHRNGGGGMWKPHTFIMLLRPRVIRALAAKYGVPTTRTMEWRELSPRVQGVLRGIGVDDGRLPEDYKNYFDTLCLVASLAAADGVGFHAYREYLAEFAIHPEVVHIGHTSVPEFNPGGSMYTSLGAYFWRRTVERWGAADLRAVYLRDRAGLPSVEEMRVALLAAGVEEQVLTRLDALV